MWLHIDAAYAGSAFICPEFRKWMEVKIMSLFLLLLHTIHTPLSKTVFFICEMCHRFPNHFPHPGHRVR